MRIDRRHFLMTAAAGAVSLPGLLTAEVEDAGPGAGATFQNPIIQGDYPDPSINEPDNMNDPAYIKLEPGHKQASALLLLKKVALHVFITFDSIPFLRA